MFCSTSMNNQPPGDFCATLATIGTNRFLELTPQRPSAIHSKSFFGGHYVQLHSFWKVALSGAALVLTSMSTQWFQVMTQKKQIDIKYEKPDSGDQGVMFLAASTQELQDFVAKYADDPGAFPERGDEKGIVFVRSKEPTK